MNINVIKTCEYCGKQIKTLYGSGRFCNSICAHAFSTKNDKKETKICKCIKCGQDIQVGKRASEKQVICSSCKKIKKLSKIKKLAKKDNNSKCKLTGYNFDQCNICKLKQLNICKCKCNSTWNIKQYQILNLKYIGTEDVINEILQQKAKLYDLYINQKLSSSDINEIYNGKRMEYLMHETLNIPRRKLSDAIKNAIMMGKRLIQEQDFNDNYQYKTEWHKTWNNKLVFLRSSYESDYAKYLDDNQIDYDVEKIRIEYFDTQKNKQRCAIPDFYLPNTNTIIEIKSIHTLDVQEMKDKVKAYKELGYNFKLILEHKEEDLYNIKIENKKVIYLS